MITLYVLTLIESVAHGLLGLIPDPAQPDLNALAGQVVSDSWFGHLSWANNYIPIDSILTVSALVLSVWGVMWVVRASIWVLGKVHLLGGGGEE